MRKAFDFWIESEEGKKCNSQLTGNQQPYLRNRLWYAYNAGLKGHDTEKEIAELKQEVMKGLTEISDLKKFIRNLTKERKNKTTNP